MIERSKQQIGCFKSEGKLCVTTKPFFCVYVLFFLTAGLLSIEQSIALELDVLDIILIFTFLFVLASAFGYFLLRDGLFFFAADQDGWYFCNKGQTALMYVPWADCHSVAQSKGDGTEIVFNINRNAWLSELKPNNANVSIDGDTLLITFSGFIFYEARKVRELNALRLAKLAKTQEI